MKPALRPGVEDAREIKSFGVAPGSISDHRTGLTIRQFGLDARVAKMVSSGPPELPALLLRGDIDAFFAGEPWPAAAVAQGAKVLPASRDVGCTDTIWANAAKENLDCDPEGLQAVLRAAKKGAGIMRNDPEHCAQGVKKIARIPIDATLKVSKDMVLQVRDFTDADYASFDGIAKFLADRKVAERNVQDRDVMQRGFCKG